MTTIQQYRKLFTHLKKHSPIPIICSNKWKWNRFKRYFIPELTHLYKGGDTTGGQYHDDRDQYMKPSAQKLFPKEFIYINPNLDPYEKIAFFLHELGHYRCKQKNCKCYRLINKKNDHYLTELHAVTFSLQSCIDLKLHKSVQNLLENIQDNAEYKYKVNGYQKAYKDLLNKNICKKAHKFLEKTHFCAEKKALKKK